MTVSGGKWAGSDLLGLAEDIVDEAYEADVPDRIQRLLPVENIYVALCSWQRRYGLCSYDARPAGRRIFEGRKSETGLDGAVTLYVNPRLVTEADRMDLFEDTVRHELAHAVAWADPACGGERFSGVDHDESWKQWCRRLGADPTRTSEGVFDDHDYYVECIECDNQWGRHRLSKTVTEPDSYRCPDCDINPVSYVDGEDAPTEPGTVSPGIEQRVS